MEQESGYINMTMPTQEPARSSVPAMQEVKSNRNAGADVINEPNYVELM